MGFGDPYRYLLHDRDSIFSISLDHSIAALGLLVLRSPPRSPKTNAICERLIGTIRRECLDWIIPMSEDDLRKISKSWSKHYNQGRPHMSLGPGISRPADRFGGKRPPKHLASSRRSPANERQIRAGRPASRIRVIGLGHMIEVLRTTVSDNSTYVKRWHPLVSRSIEPCDISSEGFSLESVSTQKGGRTPGI